MQYLLDTNICIYLIKQKPEKVIASRLHFEPLVIGITEILIKAIMFFHVADNFPCTRHTSRKSD
jgi:tRNA(fMet)-specific endonuclease VapC